MKKCVNLSIGQTIITKEPDNDPDTSYLGEYGEKIKPGCIIRYDREIYEDIADNEDYEIIHLNREYSFFYPPDNGEKPGTPEYKKYALQDYDNMEALNNSQWSFIGIVVKTEIKTDIGISDIIQSSLWGIEDHWNKDSRDYHNTVIGELKEENTDQLLKMGFKLEDIEKSFNDAVEVD